MIKLSANVCIDCRKRQLSLGEEQLGMRKCADCTYFDNIGVHTIEQYNNWLRKTKLNA